MKPTLAISDKFRQERLLELHRLLTGPNPAGLTQLRWPDQNEAESVAFRDFTQGWQPGRQVLQLEHSLRGHSAVVDAGATVQHLGVRSGDVHLPAIDRSKAAGWGTAPQDVEPGTPLNLIEPKRVWATVVVSTQLVKQTGISGAAFVEAQLLAAIGSALDRAAINGSGDNGEPVGILNDGSVTDATPGTASGPNFARIVGMEKGIADAFGEVSDKLTLICAPDVRAKMRLVDTDSPTSDAFRTSIWDSCKDFARIATPHAPDGSLILGDLSQLVIGHWGTVDILVNPYSQDTEGFVRLTATMYADVIALRPESFAFETGILTA